MKKLDSHDVKGASRHSRKFNWGLLVSLLLLGLAVSSPVLAGTSDGSGGSGGTGGTEFNPIVDWLVGALQGGLGKLLSIAAFTVGMGIGVVKQSIMAAVIGIAFAIALFFGPTVIINMFSAVI